MPPPQKHLDHAKHNATVCRHLDRQGGWPDWVITTAYYSANHYVKYALHPIKKGDKTYSDFDEYYAEQITDGRGKHRALIDLVQQFLPNIYNEFRALHSSCDIARYQDYDVDLKEAERAVQFLGLIETECTKLPRTGKRPRKSR